MKTKLTSEDLDDTIRILEEKQASQLSLLKEQFYLTYESVRPLNFLKETLSSLAKTPEFQGNLKDNLIGFATGFLTKKVIIGKTMNPLQNIAGVLFQIGVTDVVSRNSENIKIVGKRLYQILTKSIKKE